MAFYESIFLVRQDALAYDVHKLSDSFTKLVNDFGGKVVRKEYWGIRSLPYLVNKNSKAHFMALYLDCDCKVKSELESKFRNLETIIRFFCVKVDFISELPSAMMSAPSE